MFVLQRQMAQVWGQVRHSSWALHSTLITTGATDIRATFNSSIRHPVRKRVLQNWRSDLVCNSWNNLFNFFIETAEALQRHWSANSAAGTFRATFRRTVTWCTCALSATFPWADGDSAFGGTPPAPDAAEYFPARADRWPHPGTRPPTAGMRNVSGALKCRRAPKCCSPSPTWTWSRRCSPATTTTLRWFSFSKNYFKVIRLAYQTTIYTNR